MCGTRRYRYSRPVCLGDHRLILRPRDSHDLRLIQTSLNLSPAASIHWFHDVFGNSKKRKQDPRTTSHNIAQHRTRTHSQIHLIICCNRCFGGCHVYRRSNDGRCELKGPRKWSTRLDM
ncbi:MAG TPA: transglutaminase N-terminal domain-containing protein [Xanthobacteraceae bacterium]|nr:transglutaminase N-terminal domain-containing protein [Xanthobacteraceae bacterium]